MLYFIKSGNYCKIGYSRDLKALFTRLRNYLTHNPSFQILDLRSGDKMRESQIHSMIPPDLQHYGEWCVWSKEIARLWLRLYNVKPEESIEEYFIKRNKAINGTTDFVRGQPTQKCLTGEAWAVMGTGLNLRSNSE